MKMPARVVVALLLTFSDVVATLAQDDQFVTAAQRVLVSSLDPTMPHVPFARWLAQSGAVPESTILWEVNDCGEGSDGQVAPTCVEAVLDLTSGTTAHASLIVAARDRTSVKPAIYMLYAVKGNVVVTSKFNNLREWAAYVRRYRR